MLASKERETRESEKREEQEAQAQRERAERDVWTKRGHELITRAELERRVLALAEKER